MRKDYIGPSCTDHGCIIRKPEGMGTNGGCRCADYKGRRYIQWLEKKLEALEEDLAWERERRRQPRSSSSPVDWMREE